MPSIIPPASRGNTSPATRAHAAVLAAMQVRDDEHDEQILATCESETLREAAARYGRCDCRKPNRRLPCEHTRAAETLRGYASEIEEAVR